MWKKKISQWAGLSLTRADKNVLTVLKAIFFNPAPAIGADMGIDKAAGLPKNVYRHFLNACILLMS